MKVIYNAISKTLLYHYPERPRVLLLGPTGMSAVNVCGTTIHSGLGIKPGIKLLGLNNKSKAALRNKLSEVKFLIIDELSMVSSDLWIDINSRFEEVLIIIPEKAFASLSVMTVSDFLQLPPVLGEFIFPSFSDKDSMKHLLGLQLWHLIKYAELTVVVRQNDKVFIDFLNKVRAGNIDDDAEKLLKARFISESDENYPKDALHMYAENEPAMERNEAVLNDLPGELYTVEADDKVPDNCKYPLAMTEAAQNQKQSFLS